MSPNLKALLAAVKEPTPRWVDAMFAFEGLREIPGAKNNPQLMAQLDWADGQQDGKTVGANNDDEAYCAKGISANFEMQHIVSTRSAWARSYMSWGQDLGGPAVGAVVVFWRDSPQSSKGHVGIVVGRNAAGKLLVFGWNQKDSVRISAFDLERVLGYRWPKGMDRPKFIGFNNLPMPKFDMDGTVSTSEA